MESSYTRSKTLSRREFLKLSGMLSLGLALSACGPAQGVILQGAASDLPVRLADVKRAQDVVKNVALHTPLVEEQALSKICGARVYLKLENLQHTGAFKVRGAFNKISSLTDAQRARGVIAASAGNHAQGVALAASIFKIPATIVMPVTVPQVKLEATRAYGASVVLQGNVFDESLAIALEMQQKSGAVFVHPYDDPLTIAGQGTIGLEILDDLPEPDIILIPVGGGGLASGIAVAVKSTRPSVRVMGVEPQNAPSMAEALKQGHPTAVQVIPTLSEGTAVGKAGEITFKIIQKLLDSLITVSEDEIAEALKLLLLKDKVVAEGAGALGAAALLSGKLDVKGKKVVLVVSGGNIDQAELEQLLAQ
jgi:threonine dehydratase